MTNIDRSVIIRLNYRLSSYVDNRSPDYNNIILDFKKLLLLYYYISIFEKRILYPEELNSLHNTLNKCMNYLLTNNQLNNYDIQKLVDTLTELKKTNPNYRLDEVIAIIRGRPDLDSLHHFVISDILFKEPIDAIVLATHKDTLSKAVKAIDLPKIEPKTKVIVSLGAVGHPLLPLSPRLSPRILNRPLTKVIVNPLSPTSPRIIATNSLTGNLVSPLLTGNAVSPLTGNIIPPLPGNPQQTIYKNGEAYNIVGIKHHNGNKEYFKKYLKYKTKYLELKTKLNL